MTLVVLSAVLTGCAGGLPEATDAGAMHAGRVGVPMPAVCVRVGDVVSVERARRPIPARSAPVVLRVSGGEDVIAPDVAPGCVSPLPWAEAHALGAAMVVRVP